MPTVQSDLDLHHPQRLLLSLTLGKELATLGKKKKKNLFENIVGKGENAGNQHFLLCQQFFLPFQNQISNFRLYLFYCLQMLSKRTSLLFARDLTLYQTVPTLKVKSLWKTYHKRHFLLFLQCSQSYHRQKSSFWIILFCHLQTLSIWTSREFRCLVKS